MSKVMSGGLLVALSVFTFATCYTPTLGTASTMPVTFGKQYSTANTNAANHHTQPIVFGIVFGERKNHSQLLQELQERDECVVLKEMQLLVTRLEYAGFGTLETKVLGVCLK